MLHKSFDAVEVKTDGDTGTFQALVAVFNNVDSVGDRIVPGAFTKTLNRWKVAGDPVPIILSHQKEDIMSHVGYAMPDDLVQTPKGLLVKEGHLDIEDNPVARQVYKLMKQRRLKEFSFGYKVPRGGEKRANDGANELHEIELIELGPTLKGANPDTELHAVKSALAETEPRDEVTLRKAADQILRESQAEQLVKADEETEEGEQDALEVVLELLGDFLETEDDPDDIAAAKDIVTRVQALLNSEEAETPDDSGDQEPKSEVELRRQSRRLEREKQAKQLVTSPINVEARLKDAEDAMLAREAFDPSEVAGIQDGLLKAVWTGSYVNDLPDSAFLYVESGGSKDADGKTTPRSLRHFPYKDANGKVDLPHLRNALARIPQSDLPQNVKDRVSAQAQRILANSKSEPVAPDKEPTRARSADPLRKRSLEAVLEIQSDGLSRRKSPAIPEPVVEAAPEADLRRQSRDLMLSILMETE